MNIRIIQPARDELHEATLWYDLQQPGLGSRFETEVYAAMQRVLIFPNSCTLISKTVRRCLVRRFPYGVL